MHAATLNKVDKTPLVIDETVVTFAKVVSSGAWCMHSDKATGYKLSVN